MKILLIVFILIVLSILLSIKKENFVNSFDDILDNKCTELNQNLNNYIGPWDGENGRCGTYTCPLETCSYIAKDNNIRNIAAYTYKQETQEKILKILDNNERECESRNGTKVPNYQNPVANSTYICVDDITNSIRNSPTHNEIDFCYVPRDQGDNNASLRWSKQTYVNAMNIDGTYNWLNIDTGSTIPEPCIKEPLDCSQCNYYCCEYYTGEDENKKCTKQTATNADTYIHHNLKRQVDTGEFYCEAGNACAIIDCKYNSKFYKDCWVYKDDFDDSSERKWINKRFERKMLRYNNKDTCAFFYQDENKKNIQRYEDVSSMCKDDPPDINADECGIKPTISCTYLDEHNNAFDVNYKSVLNNKGDACIYQTLTNEDINYTQNPFQTQVISEANTNKADICPTLTPKDCIPKGDEELFLDKVFTTKNKTSYKCLTCSPGKYRNKKNIENENATNEVEACTDEAKCPSVNECSSTEETNANIQKNCKSCWSNIDNSGDILKKVFLETSPYRSDCKVKNDICYYNTNNINDEKTKFDCIESKEYLYGGQTYCDNCPSGQALNVEDDYLVCSELIECDNLDNICLNPNPDQPSFSTYTYDNQYDKFSKCVYWKEKENTLTNKGLNDCTINGKCMERCEHTCPTMKINDVEIHLVREGNDCVPIIE